MNWQEHYRRETAACARYIAKLLAGDIPRENWESDEARSGAPWTMADEISVSIHDLTVAARHIDGVHDYEVVS